MLGFACLSFIPNHTPVGKSDRIQSLDIELERLQTDTALVVPSPYVDGAPYWSPNGRYLLQRLDHDWFKIDINRLKLGLGSWREGLRVGVLVSQNSVSHPTK